MKSVSGKDLCRVLERKGWVLQRTNGSHAIYGKAGVSTKLSVPVHGNKTLSKGLQHALMKEAGLTKDDL